MLHHGLLLTPIYTFSDSHYGLIISDTLFQIGRFSGKTQWTSQNDLVSAKDIHDRIKLTIGSLQVSNKSSQKRGVSRCETSLFSGQGSCEGGAHLLSLAALPSPTLFRVRYPFYSRVDSSSLLDIRPGELGTPLTWSGVQDIETRSRITSSDCSNISLGNHFATKAQRFGTVTNRGQPERISWTFGSMTRLNPLEEPTTW